MAIHLFITPTLSSAFEYIAAHGDDAGYPYALTPVHDVALPPIIPSNNVRQFATVARDLLSQSDAPITIFPSLNARRLVGALLARMAEAGEIPTLALVARKRGMVREVNGWIRELETQGVAPETIAAHDPANPIEQELSRIYAVYCDTLAERQQADTDGIVAAAAALLESGYPLPQWEDVHLTVVGFDQFEPMPRRLLRALGQRVARLDLYLAGDPQRARDSLALARLGATYNAIVRDLPPARERPLSMSAGIPHALRHLQAHLFESPAPLPLAVELESAATVRAIAAPSREGEVRAALRAAHVLIETGTAPTDIALLAPDPAPYQRVVQSVAQEYGLPVRLSQPLLANPAAAAWVALLSLAPRFPRRETLDALRSPYVRHDLALEEIDLLDRLTRERPVIAAVEQWMAALQPYYRPTEAEPFSDDDLGAPPLWRTIPADRMEALREKVRAFFRAVTPPEYDSARGYGAWLLERLPPVEEEEDTEQANRDIPVRGAIREAVSILRQDEGARLRWEQYRADLLDILGDMPITLPAPPNAIYFGALSEGRRRVLPHLFVLGLNEGEFPSPPAPDPFYAPAEREEHPHLREEFAGDDASLWWQTVSNVTHTLTLLRPRLNEKGVGTLASPFWEAVRAQLNGLPVETPPLEETAAPAEAISANEWLIAAATCPDAPLPDALRLQWNTIRRAEQVRNLRESMAAPGAYEGVIQHPALLAEIERRYGERRDWSVSQLHRYAECPYGFFAQHVLALRPMGEPEEGLDRRTGGQLYHAILEALYAWMHEIDCYPCPERQEEILAQLDALCEEHFRNAPPRYQFRPDAMWAQEQEEMRRHLRALVLWECEQNRGHTPAEQERRFGNIPGTYQIVLELDADGLPFRLQGVIDRIDYDESGTGVHVVDYKSGNSKLTEEDIRKGRALQTALYPLALERMGTPVRSSRYLLVRKREECGVLEFEGSVAEHETVQAALARIGGFLRAIRAGYFPANPETVNKSKRACRDSCELAGICRVTRMSLAKRTFEGGLPPMDE